MSIKQRDKTPPPLYFRNLITEAEVIRANEIEQKSFPPGEAEPLERFLFRFRNAPGLFLGAFHAETHELAGYLVATKSKSERITDEAIRGHDDDGHHICMHSLAVDEKFRSSGIGSIILTQFLDLARKHQQDCIRGRQPPPTKMSLLCHKHLEMFYGRFGFTPVGKSAVVMGPEEWHECEIRIPIKSKL